MTIAISLSLEIEAQLREKAARQGQDLNLVAAELLSNALARHSRLGNGRKHSSRFERAVNY